MDSLVMDRQPKKQNQQYEDDACGSQNGSHDPGEERGPRHNTHMSVSSEPESGPRRSLSSLYHGTWPVERAMWNSEPTALAQRTPPAQLDVTSVMSFASSSGAAPLEKVLHREGRSSSQQLEVKVDMVYSLLSMLGTQECPDMGETLLALSSSPESSLAMRQAGCLPVLVQLVYSDKDKETRQKASKAMANLIQVQPEEKLKKRENKLLKQLEDIRLYCDDVLDQAALKEDVSAHPTQITENIIKLSFDEGYRQTICELGGIYALARLIEVDHVVHSGLPECDQCVTLRRYAGMALTNLTFGSSHNKALLCSFRNFMKCLVVQLKSHSEELRQVTACVLRNLSWRPDPTSKVILREVGSVSALMSAAMISEKESTLKSILSALWNLSAHCSMNKADICSVEGALGFLVDMLSYKSPSKTLTITETVGGIFRNISNHIAVREDYRLILREHNCLQVLLQHLKSPSLTIVSNACGTLWNLSARCPEDQKALWEMGAVPMLRSLNHSKHMMIATGSRAALKNLLSSKPCYNFLTHVDSTSKEMGLPTLPTLNARKIRALVKDLQTNLSETCDNIEPVSPTMRDGFNIEETSKPTSPSHWKFKYSERPQDEDETNTVFDNRNRLLSNDNQICDAFSSLNITDRCKNDNESNENYSRKSHYSQNNYGSASLPFVNQNNRPNRTSSSFIPVRNKYSDCSFEDEHDTIEQPVDYSQKYAENTKTYTTTKTDEKTIKQEPTEFVYSNKPINNQKNTDNSYGDYAETDLDQPTDYSLRYAENDSDSDEICKNNTHTERFYEQDTIKTYCTEGTPYETPYNFSTATSMSDLRIDPSIDEKPEMNIKTEEQEKVTNGKDSAKDTSNEGNTSEKKVKSCFSSGMMSPEKPVNYCEEGTPRYFSRVSSFSSLNSVPVDEAAAQNKDVKIENLTSTENEEKVIECANPENEEEAKSDSKVDRDAAKVVTFGQVVDYAEETPLMFSRSSSLSSLNSAEQHSIHDDRSSIISDHSRLTSGIISPSELPDSPTQTVPPSPRHRKAPLEFPIANPEPQSRAAQKSVFEDNVVKYKEVNTPVDFSTNTSLSSLTIDDEPNVVTIALLQNNLQKSVDNSKVNNTENSEKPTNDMDKQTENTNGTNELPPVSEGEEDGEEDMLAACINIGMQNNRHRQNKQANIPKPRSTISGLPKYQIKPPVQRTGIPVKLGTPPSFKSPESRLPLPESRIKNTEIDSDTVRTYCTEDTPAMLSHAGSQSDLSVLSISSKDKPTARNDEKPEFSDESSNLSGDNDSMLAECIQSGMPKARKQITPPKMMPHKRNMRALSEPAANVSLHSPQKNGISLQQKLLKNIPYTAAKDEVESYAVEDSPCHFSLRSSLSDLTVDGIAAAVQRRPNRSTSEKAEYCTDYGAYSSPAYEPGSGKESRKKPSASNTFNKDRTYAETSEEPVTVLSRDGSLSSLSVDSFGSTENAEQALLEQCISSGMPKSKSSSSAKLVMDIVSGTKPLLVSNVPAPTGPECSGAGLAGSKNAYAASVVTSTPTRGAARRRSPARTAGVDHLAGGGASTIDENLMTGETKSGYDVIDKCSDILDGSVEDNASPDSSDSEAARFRRAQSRMLDPDAMIESLDRFTAELVSQSSHLQHSQPDCKLTNLTHSNHEADTWNEDTSPNDVSFPSISVSVPLAASFKSEPETDRNTEGSDCLDAADAVDAADHATDDREESNNFSSLNTTTLTDSTLIAMEATKLANVVKSEMVLSITSVASLELDHVKPPSMMESLISMTSSASGLWDSKPKPDCNSIKNSPTPNRKKSLPVGLMVRRALSNTNHQTKSLESLTDNASVSSSCNLDHVKPPSAMGDYLDLVDMENSMVSVASITSEVADPVLRADFALNVPLKETSNWMFEVKASSAAPFHTQHSIVSDIDNVNPPSLLNEVTDMCNSTADVASDNLEDCSTHIVEGTVLTADEVTEYSDANSLTPIQSDFASSSAESTPKRVSKINKRLTPKQKRQLVKERYKTYTVAAEMVIREEQKMLSGKTEANSTDPAAECAAARAQQVESGDSGGGGGSVASPASPAGSARLTPKERRQSDRARFQTRVLGSGDLNLSPAGSSDADSNVSDAPHSPARSASKLDLQRAMRQRRLENKDRFRTRTLSSDGASASPELSPGSERRSVATYDLHLMLELESNKVLDTLKQTSKFVDLLDCETLSLVSNEDEQEHNSVSSVNYRTYHKSWSFNKNLPVIHGGAVADTAVADTAADAAADTAADASNSTLAGPAGPDEPVPSNDGSQHKPNSPKLVKPKIIKPEVEPLAEEAIEEPEEVKAVRGRRKPLYSSPKKQLTKSIKPIKTVTSNLVKNVTSTLRTGTATGRANSTKPPVKPPASKPPIAQKTGTKSGIKPPQKTEPVKKPAVLERQGTFTKDELKPTVPEKPKMSATSRIARAITGRSNPPPKAAPKPQAASRVPSRSVTSSSADRLKKLADKPTFYSRSPSADRELGRARTNIHGSASSQSLQNGDNPRVAAASKRSSIPNMAHRSNSNVSIASTDSKKKQVTSKIASLWKRVEETKKQAPKKDTRVWISQKDANGAAKGADLVSQVKLRDKKPADNSPKRISRLGSFILVDEASEKQNGQKSKVPVS